MKIVSCKYSYIDGNYLKDIAIAFDKEIVKIAPLDELKKEFSSAEITTFSGNSILYPGFINLHTHLEFGANQATLNYGNFISWLNSVIEYREELVERLNNDLIKQEAKQMLLSGVTTFGAISSFGAEMEVCKNLEQRVIFFNEIIGSNPGVVDAMFSDFKNRLQTSMQYKSDKFIPAVAVHSPYSVHPILIREVLKIAKEQNLITTAHFLESNAEREWLEEAKGEFLEFFKNFSNTTKPINNIEGFLKAFDDKPTLFTHAAAATKDELEYINSKNHSIIHCPRSNRLLGCEKLDINSVDSLCVGTDGLSSNYSLSILEELKIALFMHHNIELKTLAQKLIKSITTTPADAINLNIGKLQPNYKADFAIFKLPNDLKDKSNGELALHTIINCQKAEAVYVDGEEVV